MAVARLPGMTGTREWVYPQSIRGTFTRLRRCVLYGNFRIV